MVKKGYKQTEVGVIPEDWECVKIKDVATISMCKRIFANQTSTIGDVPFYKIGTFGKEADAYISSKLYVEYRNKYSFPQKGDILISAAGTLGRTVVYDGEKAYFQDSNIVWLDINKTRLCNEYLNQYYKVIKWASSEGSTIARLYNGIIYATYISLPPLPEQQRIAEALSDVDGMISSLEKLVAKYKSIKTACLQQMFPQNGETVPRMRLPGFTGAWEQRKFDEVFDCTVPNNTLSRAELSYDEGTVLNVHYGDVLIKYGSVLDVQKDDIPRIPHRCREDFNGALLQDGDVIIADTAEDETTGKACEIGNLQGRAIVSGLHTMVCRPRHRMALGYLGYYLNSNAYHHQLLPLMQGIKVLSLSRRNIQKTSVSYPSAVKEQQLIASYFSQLDNLITLHQRKLDKAKKIKQGMMQQLLTGKIRLV